MSGQSSGGNFFSNLFGNVGNAISNGTNALGYALNPIGNGATNFLASLAGGNNSNGLLGNISTNLGNDWNSIKPYAKTAVNGIGSFLGGNAYNNYIANTYGPKDLPLPPGFDPTTPGNQPPGGDPTGGNSTQQSAGPGGITLGSYNPTSLNQDQRNWLWTQNGHSGQAPIGYGGESASGGGSSIGPGSPSDYYQSALQMMQPIIQQETQPLQQEQQLLPSIYQNMQKTLTDQQAANTQTEQDYEKNLNNQLNTTEGISKQQAMEQAGQQRANAAANGIASSSGVEKSQEATTNQNLANTLTQLETNVSGQETMSQDKTAQLNTQLSDQIAALPNQQAKDFLSLGSEIAKINGGGIQTALSYASSMAQFQSDLYFKQANLQLAQGNQQIAYENMILGNQIKQGQLGIEGMQAKISGINAFANTARLVNPPTTTSTSTTPANLFGGLIQLPWGLTKTTTSQSSGLNPSAANALAGMYSSLFGGQ